jgi:hypothetical protein
MEHVLRSIGMSGWRRGLKFEMGRIKRPLAVALIALVAVLVSRVGEGEEPARPKLGFEEILKRFPRTSLKPAEGRPANQVLPKLKSVKRITAKVAQQDEKGTWLMEVELDKKDFSRLYKFVSDSISVNNECELNIIAFLKIETEGGDTIDGLVLNFGSEPIIYAFRNPEHDENWTNFATTRSEEDVVEFFKSLRK